MNSRKFNFSLLLFPLVFTMAACAGSNTTSQGYDGRTFDISINQDNSLTLKSVKDGNNYSLEISGTGRGRDYSSSALPEWTPLNQFVKDIKINDGITYIGDYYFNNIKINEVFLPSSVNEIAANSFHKDTKLYSYSTNKIDTENKIYYYSETQPYGDGDYFHIDDNGELAIWPKLNQKVSVLFVGNSYTFYGGAQSVTEPGVPTYFSKIAKNLKYDFDLDFVVKGSHKLIYFADANDEMGKILDTKLRTNKYTHVILQEHSTQPVKDYASFNKGVKSLKTKIDSLQENCQTILYETWGSEGRLSSTGSKDIPDLESKLRKAYEKSANENNCGIHYVGKAFTEVYLNHKEINLYNKDKVHQSDLGAYLSAAVHVKGVFKADLTIVSEYCGLDQTSCKTLLEVANKM